MLKINKGNNRASALTSGRQLAAACRVNGYMLLINVMDPLEEQEVKLWQNYYFLLRAFHGI